MQVRLQLWFEDGDSCHPIDSKGKGIMGAYFKLVNLTKREVVRRGAVAEDGSMSTCGWYTGLEDTGPALARLCMTRWAGDRVALLSDSWATTTDEGLWQKAEKFKLLLAIKSHRESGRVEIEICETGSSEKAWDSAVPRRSLPPKARP